MNNKILLSSIIAVAILVLVSFTGVVGYQIKSSTVATPGIRISEHEKEQNTRFSVIEYKSDGTSEKTFLEIPLHQAEDLRNELKKSTSFADRYSIYQNHGFIPKNVTLEQLRTGMVEKSQLLGLSEENLQTIHNNNPTILPIFSTVINNSKCSVFGAFGFGFRGIFGSSAFTRIINGLILNLLHKETFILSLDLIMIQAGLLGGISTENGTLPDAALLGVPVVIILIGFVGYYITTVMSLPGMVLEDVYMGYALYVVAACGVDFPSPY